MFIPYRASTISESPHRRETEEEYFQRIAAERRRAARVRRREARRARGARVVRRLTRPHG